ncbi:hypothetical protein [Lacticaseibacillus parakribbianus]|uniref:hypothetical protein n=1 Tax=Lacticaseibacillus parakribbianus TaxID=2970927 RepID=UPI0021CB1674|nr:hypothetical protein [Lacticaseibacillus parakribbianus]
MIEYETICPECLTQSRNSSSGRIQISLMMGSITDADFVEAKCQNGHTINIFPREGKYNFILAHAFRAFQSNQFYEAAASGYAALEDFMKVYIQASTWVAMNQPEDVKKLYEDVSSNKLLMGNSTRIIGAYAYLYQTNTGTVITPSEFEKMSHIRDDIIHAVKLPKRNDVEKLLVSIYKHLAIASIRWTHSPKKGNPLLQQWIPDYKMQLAIASLKTSGMASKDVQGSINQLSQSTTLFLPETLFFDNVDARNSEIEAISTGYKDATVIAKMIPDLQAYA